jgi:type IX secretion system PorP/SprF family membrane protein
MSMKNLNLIIFIAVFMIGQIANAQQQAMFSQYMHNGLAINPAYAGSQESLSMTALVRQQWVGVEGSPSTQTVSGHMPFEKKRIGVGLMVLHDKITVNDQTGVYGSYAYKIPLQKGQLALGVQAGFTFYSSTFSEISLTDQTFATADVSEFHPNFGFGAYYSTERFYAGFSIPQLVESKFDKNNPDINGLIRRHYFIHSGYVFDLNHEFKLKPNILVKIVDGASLEIDWNANFYYKNLIGLGLSWRTMDAFVALLHVQVTNNLQFGYAYDITTTSIRKVSYGSHELFLNYRISLSKSKIITPRYI